MKVGSTLLYFVMRSGAVRKNIDYYMLYCSPDTEVLLYSLPDCLLIGSTSDTEGFIGADDDEIEW